ncbi:N-acetylmuramoyl-L-alanine amidase [Kaarinaea lacus]
MKMKHFALLFCFLLPAFAQAAQVNAVRMWSSPEGTRVVFDVDRKVEHNVFVLQNPDRVVIDLERTRFARPVTALDYSESLVKGIRTGTHENNNLRVVLDMKSHVLPKTFLLNPTKQYGYRLVVDLESVNGQAVTPAPDPAPASRSSLPQQGRDIVVAIDAGHGGEDPGAIGRRGTREKDVALSIARKLEALLRQEQGIKPVLIRSGDYYISLRGRIRKAREHKADLFISIHADAFRNGRAKGASVYVLSQRGASSEAARWLAASENDADLIGGVSLDDKDDLLASVLLDLSQNATLAASMDIGDRILAELKHVGHVHKRQIEHAGFVVLKAPDVPSILVETGFISNRQEESQLRSQRHQQRIASALLQGIKRYFNDNPPAGTLLASASKRQHLVAEGDTLSSIARQYRISPHQLQSVNGLSSDKIKAGHTLIIPMVGGS